MNDIAVRVKQIRKDWGLNQVEFAKRVGVTNAHISAIEKGKTTPSKSLIKLICHKYKINERWLLEGKEPMDAEDLETQTETTIESAINRLNKIRTRDNMPIRSRVVQLEALFVDILDVEDIMNDDERGQYYDIFYRILYHLNIYLVFQKKTIQSGQTNAFTYPDDVISDIEGDLRQLESLFTDLILTAHFPGQYE